MIVKLNLNGRNLAFGLSHLYSHDDGYNFVFADVGVVFTKEIEKRSGTQSQV